MTHSQGDSRATLPENYPADFYGPLPEVPAREPFKVRNFLAGVARVPGRIVKAPSNLINAYRWPSSIVAADTEDRPHGSDPRLDEIGGIDVSYIPTQTDPSLDEDGRIYVPYLGLVKAPRNTGETPKLSKRERVMATLRVMVDAHAYTNHPSVLFLPPEQPAHAQAPDQPAQQA